jgi:hypothetical protein
MERLLQASCPNLFLFPYNFDCCCHSHAGCMKRRVVGAGRFVSSRISPSFHIPVSVARSRCTSLFQFCTLTALNSSLINPTKQKLVRTVVTKRVPLQRESCETQVDCAKRCRGSCWRAGGRPCVCFGGGTRRVRSGGTPFDEALQQLKGHHSRST